MGKFDGMLFCTDFDGTLAVDGVVSEENARAVRYFQENGGLFTLISGRPVRTQRRVLTNIKPNTYVCGCNGAEISTLDESETVYRNFLKPFAKECHLRICSEIEGIVTFNVFTPQKRIPVEMCEYNEEYTKELLKHDVYKLVYAVDSRLSDSIKQRISDIVGDEFIVVRSSIRGIELINAEDCKGKAARRLANIVGADTLVCAGDYENDLRMIEEADIGYAVGNSCDALKAVADRITVNVEDHAIARIIEEL